MNKVNLLLLAGAAALASCASEDVINSGDINPPTGGQAMSFGMLTGNMSRADMEYAGHKDFGVFAYKGTDMATGLVMDNYWVKYDDDETGTTWGDGNNSENGKSHWVYETLTGHKQDGAAQAQVLKYWDYSFANHYFVAYTPYNDTSTPVTLLEANSGASTELKSNLHILGANSFWTKAERDNNEAMYATSKVEKADYNKDVTLTFNHLNAVVRLAFRSNIPGYTVKIINLVPTTSTVTSISEVQYGVQLTPATEEQKGKNIGLTSGQGDAQPDLSQLHADKATFNVADVFATTPNITTTDVTGTTANLVFNLGETQAEKTELGINNGADAAYTPLGSQYFALPLTNAEAYKDTYATGYTLHVTYELIPNDHAANTTVYDARVFIPATACQWAYGKAYTYNFTITTASTGVTDPNQQIYDGGSTPSNYVDPTDPRVPDTKALLPIVFDGVTVNDYAAEANSDDEIN